MHAVDVAFHEEGLNYGDRRATVMQVVKKLLRTALCLNGYFGVAEGEIIFASPKITNSVSEDFAPCLRDLNALFRAHNYQFIARIISNDDFNDHILEPILAE